MADKVKNKTLEKNLKTKGVVIPVIFAIAVVIMCIVISTAHISVFPDGNHKDSLTTTEPTQITEYNDEFKTN